MLKVKMEKDQGSICYLGHDSNPIDEALTCRVNRNRKRSAGPSRLVWTSYSVSRSRFWTMALFGSWITWGETSQLFRRPEYRMERALRGFMRIVDSFAI